MKQNRLLGKMLKGVWQAKKSRTPLELTKNSSVFRDIVIYNDYIPHFIWIAVSKMWEF